MTTVDHKRTYKKQADQYESLVAREDYQGNLLPAINAITPINDKVILDLGSGTGRVAGLLSRQARSVAALDVSHAMIRIAKEKFLHSGLTNCSTGVADHRFLPIKNETADVIISGWSVCYLADWYPETWRQELITAFGDFKRVLKKDGVIILIETQGTGFERPHGPPHLDEYFRYLTQIGFQSKWIRTDYQFRDLDEAKELAGFFFGDELLKQVIKNKWVILPECTGFWWVAAQHIRNLQ